MAEALVLGARRDSGNIGDVLVRELNDAAIGWSAVGDDCWRPSKVGYHPPRSEDMARYDALVVSLGRSTIRPFPTHPEGDLEDVIRACLTLPLLAVKRYVQGRQPQAGTVVLVGSYAHDHVLSNSAPYCAAKAGLHHATRCLAWDLGDLFRFHIVHPYHVEGTPMERYVIEAIKEAKGLDDVGARAYQRKDLLREEPLTADAVARVIIRQLDDWDSTRAWENGQATNLYGGVR